MTVFFFIRCSRDIRRCKISRTDALLIIAIQTIYDSDGFGLKDEVESAVINALVSRSRIRRTARQNESNIACNIANNNAYQESLQMIHDNVRDERTKQHC